MGKTVGGLLGVGDSGAEAAANQARAEAEKERKQSLAEQARKLSDEERQDILRRRLQFGGGLGGSTRRNETLG